MADSAPYGVYVSIRRPTGELVSVNRETVDEVRKDLEAILGDKAEGWFERFGPADEQDQAIVASPPPVSAPVSTGQPVAPAVNAPVSVDDLPADGFEHCEKCGTLKDKWVAPGISKAGKPYPGFWTCPAWSPQTH